MTLKTLDVHLDIWKWGGIVVVGGTSADFTRWAKKAVDVEVQSDEHAAGHAHLEKGKPWLIWVDALTNVSALAHEALHIAFGVLEVRGLKCAEPSEEAYTYTMEFILQTALASKRWRVQTVPRG